jgi:hypothetical protein
MEKRAYLRLGPDHLDWESKVVEHLHRELPYLPDMPITVTFKSIDPMHGAAVGMCKVGENVGIPLVVERFVLKPLDLFYSDQRIQPLTPMTVKTALMQTDLGSAVPRNYSTNPDMSLWAAAYPPYDGRYSFASVVEPTTEEIHASFKAVNQPDQAVTENKVFRDVVAGWISKSGELKKTASAKSKKGKPSLHVHSSIKCAAAKDAGWHMLPGSMTKVAVFPYRCGLDGTGINDDRILAWAPDSQKSSYIFDLAVLPAKVASVALNGQVHEGWRGVGFFGSPVKNGTAVATEDFIVKSANSRGGTLTMKIEDGLGREFTLTKTSASVSPSVSGNVVMIPNDWRFYPVTGELGAMSTDQYEKMAEVAGVASGRVQVREINGRLHPLLGQNSEKIAAAIEELESEPKTVEMIEKLAAGSAITTYSISFEHDGTEKRAEAVRWADRIRRNLFNEMTFVKAASLENPLAEFMPGFEKLAVSDQDVAATVDSALSLNFLTPDNMYRLSEMVTPIEDARDKCAELLLATRIGMDMDQAPLRTAMFALDAAARDLREFRASEQMQPSVIAQR